MHFTVGCGGWTGRQTDRQTDSQTDGRTDRQLCDQLAGMKAIEQCTCNHRLLTSMKVQIGIYLKVNNQVDR